MMKASEFGVVLILGVVFGGGVAFVLFLAWALLQGVVSL
jgi:hypothetical protein